MERKKPEKLKFALPVNNSEYFEGPPLHSQSNQPQNLNESLFFKYASSIIQVVSEDKLDSSCAGINSQHHRNAIFEISQVKEFEGGEVGAAGSICREQNNYNNIAAKMKKKGPNRKALAYNFSNLTLLSQKIYSIFLKPLKNAMETLKTFSINSDYNKTKKEIKRASFYSGYTTSTSNQQKTSKRATKRMTEERKREILEEGANSIKGWMEFKILLLSSHAYTSIKDFAANRPYQASMQISQASTIKQGPLQKFYLTEYQHDNSISIARQIPHNISESLVYTADQNFEFTQKQVTLTTPQKFGSEDRISLPPLPNHMRKGTSNQQSFVETYRPRDHFSPQTKANVSKEVIVPSVIRPIKLAQNEQRRYLSIRTNIYQLPMLTNHELKTDRQRVIKDPNHLQDRFIRNEPQTIQNIDNVLKQLTEACTLLKSKAKISDPIFNEKEEGFSKLAKNSGSRALQLKKSDVDVKKLVSSNSSKLAKQEKKDVQKMQNYYYFNDKVSPKAIKPIPSSPTIHQQKKPLQKIKSAQSILKNSSKAEKKTEKIVRIQESLVSEFTMDKNKQIPHPLPIKNHQRGQENTYMYAYQPYQPQSIEKRDERAKSRSKINIVLHPQRKESPRLNVYHHLQQNRQENRPNIQTFERDRQLNNPYGYPTSNQKPKSPNFTHNDKNMHSPKHNAPVVNQQAGLNYIMQTPTNPQRLLSQVKSNEQLKMQQIQPPRIEPVVRNSPGKVMSPTYFINSQERRLVRAPSQMRHEDKKSFYSPQIAKDAYMLSPQKPFYPINEPQRIQNPVNIRRMHTEQEYFTMECQNQQIRAINFNNNYYTSGPQSARPPSIAEPPRNVFQQQQPPKRQGYLERPPSSRQSGERANIFANYTPLDSELESQRRSNHFSKNSSELSRPKSMNQKIFITLRKEK